MNSEICETENQKLGWARPDGALQHAPMGRTTLYALLKRGVVESRRIGKTPGAKRCVRLISLESLDAYIRDPEAAELRAAEGKQHGNGGEHS